MIENLNRYYHRPDGMALDIAQKGCKQGPFVKFSELEVALRSASDNTDSQKCLCDLGSSATSNVWLLTINKDCPVHGDKWEG